MKRTFLLLFMVMMSAAFSFGDGFSGETRGEVGYDIEGEAVTYSVDAGAVYEAGWFKAGADVFTDTFKDFNIGLPLTATFGAFSLKAEPGLDNLFDEAIYVLDGDVAFSAGIFAFAWGFGYGSDKVLDMDAKITATLTEFLIMDVTWFDGTDLTNEVAGDVELGVTVTY